MAKEVHIYYQTYVTGSYEAVYSCIQKKSRLGLVKFKILLYKKKNRKLCSDHHMIWKMQIYENCDKIINNFQPKQW